MFDTGPDNAIVQRGIDEALACRDMFAPAPVHPSLFARVIAHIGALLRAVGIAFSRVRAVRRPAPGSITETIR
ncbi:MAG: hypothetical protein ACRDJC_14070 [Thermomicrobiales bacterium]